MLKCLIFALSLFIAVAAENGEQIEPSPIPTVPARHEMDASDLQYVATIVDERDSMTRVDVGSRIEELNVGFAFIGGHGYLTVCVITRDPKVRRLLISRLHSDAVKFKCPIAFHGCQRVDIPVNQWITAKVTLRPNGHLDVGSNVPPQIVRAVGTVRSIMLRSWQVGDLYIRWCARRYYDVKHPLSNGYDIEASEHSVPSSAKPFNFVRFQILADGSVHSGDALVSKSDLRPHADMNEGD